MYVPFSRRPGNHFQWLKRLHTPRVLTLKLEGLAISNVSQHRIDNIDP